MKITSENINKIAEDFLITVLDKLDEQEKSDSALYLLIDKELNRRAQKLTENQKKAEEEKRRKEKELLERLKELEEIENNTSHGVVHKAMIAEFGEEFRGDYEIDYNFTVISYARSPYHKTKNFLWKHDTLEAARKKVDELIGYRVYDHYFRSNPTAEALLRLKAAIKEFL